jgi:hypothetical protein
VARGEWHPEQDAAPGGGGAAADSAGHVHAIMIVIQKAMRNKVIRTKRSFALPKRKRRP